jgi:hypothetical protein
VYIYFSLIMDLKKYWYYAPVLKLQKGMMSGLMKSVMNENQNSQEQVHVTAVRCLRFNPGKRGLNSRFHLSAGGGGGGGWLKHNNKKIDWKWKVKTTHAKGKHADTGALLEISFLFIRQQYAQ